MTHRTLPFIAILLFALSVPIAARDNWKLPADAKPKKRPPISKILPKHFGFGSSWFGAFRDWHIETKEKHHINWDFMYTYGFPEYKNQVGTSEMYLGWMFTRAKKVGAIPIVSFYGLLKLGQVEGFKGNEAEIVVRVLKDKKLMKHYLEEVARILTICSRYDGQVIFHSEPDSWAFMQWHGTDDTHDATKCQVMVKSSGMKDAKGFSDHAGGLGKALIHLRDKYAPNCYMGFHAKDCRVGQWPEKTVKFIKACGDWDILLGDGIGHVYGTRDKGWWDTFDKKRFDLYMKWYGTVSKELGLKYIHWQSVVGKSDYTLLPDYPKKQRVADYIKAGAVAALFDIRGELKDDAVPSDKNHGYASSPPAGHPAMNTIGALLGRLEAYYKQPMDLKSRKVKR